MMPILSSIADQFINLGKQVESQYRRCNYNDAELPAIAAEALEQFDGEFTFDALAIAAFLATTSITQQPELRFSDLPITVFRQREFYIEILAWTHSTTAVHQHGFAGAFKVLQGSSIHTTFNFQPQHEISPNCIIGTITPQRTEYLQKGSIRQINPGSEGLIHSLYHLDNPSLTLVVRSHGHKKYQPQYTYFRPCLAINKSQFEKDELVGMYAKLLYASNQLNRDTMIQVWLDYIAPLDFPRLAYLFLGNLGYFKDDAERQTVLHQARQTHGDLVGSLQEAAQVKENLEHIGQSRTVLSDPDLRYFLALLMNAKDRTALLEMVEIRYPDQDPLGLCARWLARLSEGKVDTARRLAQVIQQANVGALHLGRKLGVALPPNLTDEQAQALFLSFIRHDSIDDLAHHHPDIDLAALQGFFTRLAKLEELGCLH